jgi:predicted ATPase
MVTKIEINGFKSFYDFKMEFTPLTVIAGVNASGKSNLFDALQLLSRLAETDLKTAFGEQRGSASELFTQFGQDSYADEMSFAVEMLVNKKVKDNWGGESILKYTRLRYELKIKRQKNLRGSIDDLLVTHESLENLKHNEDIWVKNQIPKDALEYWRPKVDTGKRGKPYIYTEEKNGMPTIKMPQDGKQGGKETPANAVSQTVLSGTNSIDFPHVFAAKEEMRSWKFLQLNPDDLREPTRQEANASDIITHSGKNLAAALFRIKLDDSYALREISRKLNSFLPNFIEVDALDDKANKQFVIRIKGEDGREFSSRVLSEGTLRILTLCIFLHDEQHRSLICFEEPENGIHPFRVRAMANLLKELSVDFSDSSGLLRQVIVNTHSPVLVGEIQRLSNKSISVWFSKMNTLITNIKGEKMKLKISKITPVAIEGQTTLTLSEQDKKMTSEDVKEYLEKLDFENTHI